MMGAKNHAVVMPDANKEQSLNALVGAGFGAAGQRCMATSVAVLVGDANKWIPDIVAKAKTLKLNGGTEKGADLGPVISKQARERIEGLIEKGVKEGAKLELDGRNPKVAGYEKGNFIAPTIFSGVKPGTRCTTRRSSGRCWCWCRSIRSTRPSTWSTRIPYGNGTGIFTQSAPPRASSRTRSTWARWASTCRSPFRSPTSRSPARAAPSSGDLGPYGKQVIQFYTQVKTVTRGGSTTRPHPGSTDSIPISQ
jgi:malonate-semialdehyde dehydrogenase (acetylating)/methylmalonate-semialdehyde dehydrogenase